MRGSVQGSGRLSRRALTREIRSRHELSGSRRVERAHKNRSRNIDGGKKPCPVGGVKVGLQRHAVQHRKRRITAESVHVVHRTAKSRSSCRCDHESNGFTGKEAYVGGIGERKKIIRWCFLEHNRDNMIFFFFPARPVFLKNCQELLCVLFQVNLSIKWMEIKLAFPEMPQKEFEKTRKLFLVLGSTLA